MTYSCSHLLPSSIVAIAVALCKDVVFARFEACSVIIPRTSSIWGPHSIDLGPEFGVAGDEMVWCDSCDGAFA
jgi:hypothetical protein